MFFQKLKKLFIGPTKFFKDASKEKDYWTVLKFFVVVYATATLIQILVSIPIYLSLPEFNILTHGLTAILVGAIYAFVGPFIVSAIMHLGILIVSGRKSFFNTFKTATYGTLVIIGYGLITSIVTIIFFLLDIYNAVANVIIILPLLTGVVHMLITQSIGASMYHSISRIRAFFGIILIPLILTIILLVMMIWFVGTTFLQVG